MILVKVLTCLMLTAAAQNEPSGDAAKGPMTAEAVQIQLLPGADRSGEPSPRQFTARFTPEDLQPLLSERTEFLPLAMQFDSQRNATQKALERISMEALLNALKPDLLEAFPQRFDPNVDVIFAEVPDAKQITIKTPVLESGEFRGPTEEVVGFLVHDVDDVEYVRIAINVMQTARKLLDTGDPAVDRTSPKYYELLASSRLADLMEHLEAKEAEEAAREAVRQKIGDALHIYDENGAVDESRAEWVKESRHFTYVVRDGEFIEKLRPLVERINHEIDLAGFDSPSIIEKPGIHFDPDLQDVEILLPRDVLEEFLSEADQLERRMAEEAMISIEVVRLTDRDIVNGAVATRLNAQIQGVHDPSYFKTRSTIRQAGVNALTAVANRELQIVNAREIMAGTLPEGTTPLTVPPIGLPVIEQARTATTVGSTFSLGADDVFFDGREQSYGFSYISPDGVEHFLGVDVVDSLRKFWERIERNLIVHKIKKTPNHELFSVPVGPDTKTFEGIAALISQENQKLVIATGTGALSELSATAGTWLVIRDFEITPIPGSSTALSEDERQEIHERVLMTMILRDPLIDVDTKRRLVETEDRPRLSAALEELLKELAGRSLHGGGDAGLFGDVFLRRVKETSEDATIEKKERNSKISLTFYSSQGTIRTDLGVTALGDANDLTSFTTQLSPNVVTPISSFFTKSASNTTDTAQITGLPRGEREMEEKTMTHLLVRARFPTDERERKDRDEGRYVGYFDLPVGEKPLSVVNLPFLSSSEHPLERLSQMRVGIMFASLDQSRIRNTGLVFNPQKQAGDVPRKVWEACTTRMLLLEKIIADAGMANQALAALYRERFVIEVRNLLEYDQDLFNAPNIALRNMYQWNNAQRIVLALRNSADRFPLSRLILMIDQLGEVLVPDSFIDERLAVSEKNFWGHYRIRPLTESEVQSLRRDTASHFLRIEEIYGDAFLEAVSLILGLGTYDSLDYDVVVSGPFCGYENLVFFDRSPSPYTDNELIEAAHDDFIFIRAGGYHGKLFEKSTEFLEHLPDAHRSMIINGTEMLTHRQARTAGYTGK